MILIDQDKCDLCGACISVCPPDCINLSETKLSIDHSQCIDCDHCVIVCPMGALEADNEK